MSNRIQDATGTLRCYPFYFPTLCNRIKDPTGTLRRHPLFLRLVTECKVPQEHYDASLSVFPQWVTRYKVPHKHHDISLAIFYTGTSCLSLHRLLSSHSHPYQKIVIWTSISEPDISFMCLRDESALFNPFLPKKNLALSTQKNTKLCDVLQIIDSCIRLELPKVPERAVGRTEGDVFPGVGVSSCVSQPHIVTSIC